MKRWRPAQRRLVGGLGPLAMIVAFVTVWAGSRRHAGRDLRVAADAGPTAVSTPPTDAPALPRPGLDAPTPTTAAASHEPTSKALTTAPVVKTTTAPTAPESTTTST